MANLGGFAGGVARGFTAGREMQDRRAEAESNRGFRERQIKMAEQDQAWQEQERGRQRKMQEDMALLNKEFGIGHPREVQDGEVDQDDGAGNIVKVPRYKAMPARSFGDLNTQERLGYVTKAMGLKLAHTGDPTQLTGVFEYVDKAKQTAEGQKVLAAVSGDTKAFSELVTGAGGVPEKAQFDPESYTLDLGNGKKLDIKNYLFAAGADKAFEFLRKNEADKLSKREKESNIKKAEEEAKLIPKRGAVLDAQAYQARQSGNLSGAKIKNEQAKGSGGGDISVPKAVADQVAKAASDPMTGKVDNEAYTYILRRTAGAKNTAETIDAARTEYAEGMRKLNKFMAAAKKMSDKERQARYGVTDLDDLREVTLRKMKGEGPAVQVRGGNLAADDDEDS